MGIFKKIPFEATVLIFGILLAIVTYFLFPSIFEKISKNVVLSREQLVEGIGLIFNGYNSFNSFCKENPIAWDFTFWIITVFILREVVKKASKNIKRIDNFRMLDLFWK